MHIDSKWKFKEMIQFRDEYAKKYGWNLIVESNMEAFRAGVGPFTHGSKVHTDLMKTQALLHALDKYKFDAAFGGARRDEEKSRAKERIFSFRNEFHQWDPKNQRPEMWKLYNTRIHKGESIRVFPLSNWTEADIWQYICRVMVDKRPGSEWFWNVDENGVPASRKPIVEPWKCPYHNGRMCMELIRRDPDVNV